MWTILQTKFDLFHQICNNKGNFELHISWIKVEARSEVDVWEALDEWKGVSWGLKSEQGLYSKADVR